MFIGDAHQTLVRAFPNKKQVSRCIFIPKRLKNTLEKRDGLFTRENLQYGEHRPTIGSAQLGIAKNFLRNCRRQEVRCSSQGSNSKDRFMRQAGTVSLRRKPKAGTARYWRGRETPGRQSHFSVARSCFLRRRSVSGGRRSLDFAGRISLATICFRRGISHLMAGSSRPIGRRRLALDATDQASPQIADRLITPFR
jgi:hypothetical protein